MVTLHTLIPAVQLEIICRVFAAICAAWMGTFYVLCAETAAAAGHMFFSVLVLNCMHLAQFDSDFERRCVTVKSVAFVIFPP